MATTASSLQPPTSAGEARNPDSPVPLDTIPISPTDGKGSSSDKVEGGASDQAGGASNEDPSNTTGIRKGYGEDEQITVFHDAENFNVKHPLMHTWTLWFTKPPSGKVSLALLARPTVFFQRGIYVICTDRL